MEVSASRTRQRQVQRLFAEVVGLEEDERAARLDRACAADPSLRDEVEAMLERHAEGEAISDDPPFKSSSGESLVLGEIVGHYCLLEEMGRGAMGIVYRAEDTRLKRSVALKFLTRDLSADNKARARLEREAQAASALDHPNICTVYEIGETDDGRLFLALACYDGETLENRIERGSLEIDEAVRIGVRMARGLAAAHRHGIIHRDVKPSNVLITHTDGSSAGQAGVKLLDFGIARVAGSDLTGSGDTLGTAAYMAPEQLRGEPDARSDLWALGVTLHEMLTGTRPFEGDYEAALLYAVLNEDPAPLPEEVPEELADIVQRCLEKDPELRYQSAEEVEVDLEHLRVGDAGALPRRRFSRRTRRFAYGLSALALLLILLLSPIRTVATNALGLGGPDVQHLAVLPFVSPADEASVGDGLALTLTSLLTSLGSDAERPITVVPASEIEGITTAAEARERYGVDVVVTGDFRQDSDGVHLTLNLVDAHDLRQLQSETLSEPSERLPVLQQRALASVAEMLGVPVSGERRAMLTTGGTASAEAYRNYLKGKAALDDFDQPGKITTAIQFFQWALEDDSLYALAHAGLGEAYMREYGADRENESVSRAENHSMRALELADRLASVRVTLGSLYYLTGEHGAAVEQFQMGAELDSTSVTAYHGLASAYRALQRPGEAERYYRKAIDIQPARWQTYNDLGNLYIDLGHYDQSVPQYERAAELAPNEVIPREGAAAGYLYQGDLENARLWAERSLAIRPSYVAYSLLGDIRYHESEYEAAARAYSRALRINDSNYIVWGNLGDVYSLAPGYADEAETAYRRAAELAEKRRQVTPSDPTILSDLATYKLELGENREALRLLNEVSMSISSDSHLAKRVAVLYERLEERQQALRWIEEAISRGYSPSELEGDPDLQALLADPDYMAMLK